jgi:lysyl-tRNA synthetase class 2
MPPSPAQPETPSAGHEAARRDKLRRIAEMGIDPWGQRFDGHLPMGQIRALAEKIVYRTEAGQEIALPQEAPDFKTWLAAQPAGEMHGPTVRAAGRIVLQRKAGKLVFLDIRDWTGQVQVLIGQKQVGDQSWQLAECFDLGDLVGVDGELRREAALSDQIHRAAPR